VFLETEAFALEGLDEVKDRGGWVLDKVHGEEDLTAEGGDRNCVLVDKKSWEIMMNGSCRDENSATEGLVVWWKWGNLPERIKKGWRGGNLNFHHGVVKSLFFSEFLDFLDFVKSFNFWHSAVSQEI